MKFSENTLAILKNFSSINSGIVLKKGLSQRTMSPDMTILAEVTLDENIANDFGIYDLPQFLGNVSTLGNPELEFGSDKVTMDDGSLRLNYYSCSPSLITTPPEKNLEMKSVDIKFDLTAAQMQKLLRLAAMNAMPNLTVVGKDGKLYLKTHEKNSDTSNFAMMEIGKHEGENFEKSFKTDNLKMIADDYKVSITFAGFGLFESKNKPLKYFIALESK
jgi:hypothetical protein